MNHLTVYRIERSTDVWPINPDSRRYLEDFWLPTVGPTCLWLLRRLDRIAPPRMDTGAINLAASVVAAAIGAPGGNGKHSVLARTLRRLAQFGLIEEGWDDCWGIPAKAPWLSDGLAARLPEPYRTMHVTLLQQQEEAA